MGLGLSFDEVMEGTFTPNGATSSRSRPLRFELHVEVASALGLLTRVVGRAEGALWLSGLADGAQVSGTLEISALFERRLRYRLHFRSSDGRPLRFEGDKDVSLRRHLIGWTTLPGAVYDGQGELLGSAELRFDLMKRLGPFLRSFRLRRVP